MGDFEKNIATQFYNMTSTRIASIFLRVLGRIVFRFDTRGDTSITKNDLIYMIMEAIEYEKPINIMKRKIEKRKKQ